MITQTLDPDGPAAWLIENGHGGRWAERETRVRLEGGGDGWTYITPHVGPPGNLALAHLIAEGWSVSLSAIAGRMLRISIRRPITP